MSEPFIYIASYPIKAPFVESAPERFRDLATYVEVQEPRLLSFNFFIDPDHARAICVQVHPDAESMANHMAVIAKHIDEAWDWLDLANGQELVLGSPPKVLTDYWEMFTSDGLEAYPTFAGGFTRASAQEVVG